MTCDDKDGKPDLSGRKAAPAPRQNVSRPAPVRNQGYTASPYMSPEEIAEFQAEFSQPASYVSASNTGANGARNTSAKRNYRAYGNKPKATAAPLENMEKSTADNKGAGTKEKILCPRCREGQLRRLKGKNGTFWGCTNYPMCTATFDDEHGKPLLS